MRDRLVRRLQPELGQLELRQVDQPGPDQLHHAAGGVTRVHPLAADRDVIVHQPVVGQREVIPAGPADPAHQHHPPARADREHRRQHLRGGRGPGQEVEHAVDRGAGRLGDPAPVACLVPAHRGGPHPRAQPAGEFRQGALVAAGGDHPGGPHRQRDRDPGAAEAAGGAVDHQRLARLEADRQQPAVRHQQVAEGTPAARVGRVDGTDRGDVLGRHQRLLGKRAVMVVAVQRPGRLGPVGPALEGGVGPDRVVARAQRRVAVDPVAGREPGRVRPGRADPADPARPGRDRQLQQVVARTGEDPGGVVDDPGGGHVDDDLAGAEDRVRQRLDGERRAELVQHSSLHLYLAASRSWGQGRP